VLVKPVVVCFITGQVAHGHLLHAAMLAHSGLDRASATVAAADLMACGAIWREQSGYGAGLCAAHEMSRCEFSRCRGGRDLERCVDLCDTGDEGCAAQCTELCLGTAAG
jgi:hypothetical protein